MSYQITTKVRNAVVVVDVSSSYIEEFLGGLDFGDGSVVGYITPNGREIICGQEVADGETVFTSRISIRMQRQDRTQAVILPLITMAADTCFVQQK